MLVSSNLLWIHLLNVFIWWSLLRCLICFSKMLKCHKGVVSPKRQIQLLWIWIVLIMPKLYRSFLEWVWISSKRYIYWSIFNSFSSNSEYFSQIEQLFLWAELFIFDFLKLTLQEPPLNPLTQNFEKIFAESFSTLIEEKYKNGFRGFFCERCEKPAFVWWNFELWLYKKIWMNKKKLY